MLRFILTHPRVLAFGVLLTLFSSFGQTFLISIFVPRILESFGLGAGQFGVIYAAATVASGLCLPFFGRLIDRVPLRYFSLVVGSGLAAACFGMALSSNVVMLFLSIFGLRLTGQGLLSLTASTTMARVFDKGRGKALSVSALGYPLGEGLLPLVVVLMIHGLGWRTSWTLLGALILLVFLPATQSLLHRNPMSGAVSEKARPNTAKGGHFLRDPRFYLLLPVNLAMPLILTALFLYQLQLAEWRGWSEQTMAAAFIGFAVARMLVSMMVGSLIDRWSALTILPVLLVPGFLGLGALLVSDAPWIVWVYLLLVGVSQGMAGPMMTAVWAEVYGVQSLGATKGTVATFGVTATALGPLLLGAAIGAGMGFPMVIGICLAICAACTASAIIGRGMALRMRSENSLAHPCG